MKTLAGTVLGDLLEQLERAKASIKHCKTCSNRLVKNTAQLLTNLASKT